MNDNFFEKLPNWIRWIIALPCSIIFSIIAAFVSGFAINWTYNFDANPFILKLTTQTASLIVLLFTIYFCVPKYQKQITGAISIILAILLSITTALLIDRGYPLDNDSLINVISITACIAIAIGVLIHEKNNLKEVNNL